MSAPNSVTLSCAVARQFLSDHDCLHDAEIVSISADTDNGTLEISLCDLYLSLDEMPYWLETDTKAILIFKGVDMLTITGDFIGYTLNRITFAPENRVELISDVGGVIDTVFDHFEINVTSQAE